MSSNVGKVQEQLTARCVRWSKGAVLVRNITPTTNRDEDTTDRVTGVIPGRVSDRGRSVPEVTSDDGRNVDASRICIVEIKNYCRRNICIMISLSLVEP